MLCVSWCKATMGCGHGEVSVGESGDYWDVGIGCEHIACYTCTTNALFMFRNEGSVFLAQLRALVLVFSSLPRICLKCLVTVLCCFEAVSCVEMSLTLLGINGWSMENVYCVFLKIKEPCPWLLGDTVWYITKRGQEINCPWWRTYYLNRKAVYLVKYLFWVENSWSRKYQVCKYSKKHKVLFWKICQNYKLIFLKYWFFKVCLKSTCLTETWQHSNLLCWNYWNPSTNIKSHTLGTRCGVSQPLLVATKARDMELWEMAVIRDFRLSRNQTITHSSHRWLVQIGMKTTNIRIRWPKPSCQNLDMDLTRSRHKQLTAIATSRKDKIRN